LQWAALTASVAAGSIACSLITSYSGFVGGDAGPDRMATMGGDGVEDLQIIDGPDGSCLCVDDVPPGWSMVAVSAGQGVLPGCSGGYPMSTFQGYGGLDAGPAQCTCACDPPPSLTCGSIPTDLYVDSKCMNKCASVTLQGGQCTDVPVNCTTVGSLSATTLNGAAGEACTPDASTNVPDAGWAEVVQLCAPNTLPPQGACSAGKLCAPVPGGGLAQQPCISTEGVAPCPAGPYSSTSLYYTAPTDNRGCSPCGCGQLSVTCTGSTSTSCEEPGETIKLPTACATANDPLDLKTSALTVSGASCAPSGGQATGTATPDPTTAITVCCPQ
jgi:hypothetical protein